MHEHHRQRMKNRFLREGISGFEPHNVLELLLFYSVPQKDTNELAHTLIDRFGSLSAVFDAPYEELIQVNGIKEHSATLIKLVPALAQRYISETVALQGELIPSAEAAGEFFKAKYIGVKTETVYLLLLDNKFKIIECIKLHEGSVNSSAITIRRIVEEAICNKASHVILAHNHPNGLAIPSPDDLFTTKEISRALTLVGVNFPAHILVANDKYINICQK